MGRRDRTLYVRILKGQGMQSNFFGACVSEHRRTRGRKINVKLSDLSKFFE